jgi:carboxyl-terminal processing protease
VSQLVLAFVAALLTWPPPQSPAPPSTWTVGGTAPGEFILEAKGLPTDAGGASIVLRSATGEVPGTATMTLPADAFRHRRVRLSGELETRGVSSFASLWFRVDGADRMLMLETGPDLPLRDDTTWTSRSISLPIPADARRIVMGVILRGRGTVSARNLRLETLPAVDPGAPLPPAVRGVLDAAISIVRKNALHRDKVNWAAFEPQLHTLAAGAVTSADVYPVIRYLLTELKDGHSFLMPPAQTTAFKTGGAQNPTPEVRALPAGIGYISVPGYSGGQAEAAKAYASRMHDSIAATLPSAPCGWVVDLRPNGGGNMWPMLAGLKPFLGDEGLGSFEGPDGAGPLWKAGQAVGVEPPAALSRLESAWIAVLTGPKTASSGEAVAISFKGRPRTRSFGLPTAGLSTANSTFPLPDGAMILLTVAIELDRTGRKYGGRVDPDETIAPSKDDAALAAATRWITAASGCRP